MTRRPRERVYSVSEGNCELGKLIWLFPDLKVNNALPRDAKSRSLYTVLGGF